MRVMWGREWMSEKIERIGVMFRPNRYEVGINLDKIANQLLKGHFNILRHVKQSYVQFTSPIELIDLKVLNDGTFILYKEIKDEKFSEMEIISLFNRGIEIIKDLKMEKVVGRNYSFSILAYGTYLLPFYARIKDIAQWMGEAEYGKAYIQPLEKSESFVRISVKPNITLCTIDNNDFSSGFTK